MMDWHWEGPLRVLLGMGCARYWSYLSLFSWSLLAILCSVSPFVMTFHGGLTMLEEHIRFYIQTLLTSVFYGRSCGNEVYSMGNVHELDPKAIPWIGQASLLRRPLMWATTFLLPLWILLQIVLGSIDTPLSPQAGWRRIGILDPVTLETSKSLR